ncbi:hypothetical protein [Fictibacillus sp. NRS-1165]|uniref:hypothetical protein n=1 Tax=Fictibacillus sp. NRS-1165 TaxID=3144463 RepID=UPI003D1D149E
MPKQRVYYDYVDGSLVPFWYVLTFRPYEIPWEQETYYFEVIAPFEYYDRDYFDDSILSASINIEDLLTNILQISRLGLNLSKIKQRILKHGVEPWEVSQLIIQLPDIEEVLKLLPNERKTSFILS